MESLKALPNDSVVVENASGANLLKLPTELLTMVVEQIPRESRGSFALVHSRCRQFVHALQLEYVRFDASRISLAILDQLREEAKALQNDAPMNRLSIGCFVRGIAVSREPDSPINTADTIIEKESPESQLKKRSHESVGIGADNNAGFVETIAALISQKTVFPQLYSLTWEEINFLQPPCLQAVKSSTLQNLCIYNYDCREISIEEIPRDLTSLRCPLRRLILRLESSYDETPFEVRDICDRLLFPCASTLETLIWAGGRQHTSLDDCPISPTFASLSHLELSRFVISDRTLLHALIHDGLVSLAVSEFLGGPIFDFLKVRGHMPGLQSLVWQTNRVEKNALLSFLLANTHLSVLMIPRPVPRKVLDQEIMPMLASSFFNLTSLSLAWDSPDISCQALQDLSALAGLQQLHIRAKDRQGWRDEWLIDHKRMRSYLVKLQRLKKLVFTLDTYRIGPAMLAGTYYRYKDYKTAAGLDDGYTVEAYEQDHEHRMLQEATHLVAFCASAAMAASPLVVPNNVEARAIEPTPSTYNPSTDVVVNGGFYGYPSPPSYAPFNVTPAPGNPGCTYISNSYDLCQAVLLGDYNPNCFSCVYGDAGGSTTISQQVNYKSGSNYTVE
ncbi:MAG: hypothetical protein Q9220_003342 [cf. Caloplaca sp. 1 TL-2023]